MLRYLWLVVAVAFIFGIAIFAFEVLPNFAPDGTPRMMVRWFASLSAILVIALFFKPRRQLA
jgi:hypothetical protein